MYITVTQCHNYSCLIIIGLLPAVVSLMVSTQGSTTFLDWTAPFTLDITGPSNVPDILYSVDVVNSTSSSIYSQCGINVTGISFSTLFSVGCTSYTFTVTPVNVVGNGTANAILWMAKASMLL